MHAVASEPIRIFVSSPGDVRDERGACLRAIALLNQRYRDQLTLEGVFWEEQFFPAHTDFQTWINQQVPPWSCQLVICILWSRIGTPLADAWPTRPDGTRYESGTVAEFEMSRDAALRDQTPDLYMFVKRAPLPGADTADALARSAEAKRVVEQFVQRWFHQTESVEAPGGEAVHPFTAGLNSFGSTDAFEEQVVVFLETWLRSKGYIDAPRTWDLHGQGLPYVGLAPFDLDHAAVFFGRDAERRRARRMLTEADAAQLPYLLISGGSGVGKSSLARAGLVADLCIDTPQEVWSHAIVTADLDPMAGLARVLLGGGCALAPELAAAHVGTEAALAAVLAVPDVATAIIPGALDSLAQRRAAARGWTAPPIGRLLLVVDQVEALADASPAAQRAFVSLLTALAATRRVWVAATVRADRQAALLAQAPLPEMAPLLTGLFGPDLPSGAELKLTPPDDAAMREIIEAPARAAGLAFEEDAAGRSLADDLRAAMAGHPDALPLMQKLLQRMFAATREARWADYERLGRLEGAIAEAADAAIAPLPEPSRAELRPLLLALTATIAADGGATSRPAPRASFADSAARAALIGALLDARLLVTDGQDRLRVAHEAVLRTWPRAREILAGAAAFIRLRERLRGPWEEWKAGGALLPPGPLLSEAMLALPALDAEADTKPLAALVHASVDADRRARRRRTAVWSGVTVALALLAGAAVVFAVDSRRSAAEAVVQREAAVAAAAEAGRQREVATAAAARSERSLQTALDAVNALVFDVAQALRDRAGMPTEVVRTILGMSDRVLAVLEQTAPDDDRIKQLRLVASSESSQTLLTKGAVGAARAAAEQAVALSKGLVDRHPDSRLAQRSLSVSQERLGDVLMVQGDGTAALRKYRASLAIVERLDKQAPGSAEAQRDLSVSHNKIGEVLMAQGDATAALREYRAGLEIRERLAAQNPDDFGAQRDLAVSDERIGDVLVAQGDGAGALRVFRAEHAINERLAAHDPGNALWQRGLAVSGGKIGGVLLSQGDGDSALRAYRDSAAVSERLVAQDAGNTDWQNDLAIGHSRIGDMLIAQGDAAAALREYRESLGIIDRLAAKDPANTTWQRTLALNHQWIGDLLVTQGDAAGALHEFRTALETQERLAAQDATNVDWQRDLSSTHERIGDVLAAQGDSAGALLEYQTRLTVAGRLAAQDPGNALWQRDFAVSHNKVGDMKLAQHDEKGALAQYRTSLELCARLAGRDPTNTEWQRDVSVSRNKVGDVLLAQGDGEGALREYRAGLSIRERLASQDPGNALWQRDLAVSHERIGDVLAAGGNLQGALGEYRAGLAVHERLAARDPSNAGWQRDLVVSHNLIGRALLNTQEPVAALAEFRAAIAISRRLAVLDPTNATWRTDLLDNRNRLGDLSFNLLLGNHLPEALAAATAALPGDPPMLWIATNEADALMLLGRIDEARALYLGHRGEHVGDTSDQLWEDAIRADFADLRKAGLESPLMDEILAVFGSK